MSTATPAPALCGQLGVMFRWRKGVPRDGTAASSKSEST
eukprot:CAMPEP_0179145498 /NCGR_PEP_ID=MMETSP0796-20121207/70200_1 /TAXON_ID=73915 /ORGANISM="Pyrodinium bahamense, Strain pbaha01" /LENGTH=38 /DNA_ID= /DNA_START= /DNA_END= /DNA_ORIENTATION=